MGPGYRNDDIIGHHNPELPQAYKELDVKDQHLIELATKNGFLIGRNSVLENDNYRLREKTEKLEKQLQEAKDEREQYKGYWREELGKTSNLEAQVSKLQEAAKPVRKPRKTKKGTK